MIQAYEFAVEKIGLDYSSYPVSSFSTIVNILIPWFIFDFIHSNFHSFILLL